MLKSMKYNLLLKSNYQFYGVNKPVTNVSSAWSRGGFYLNRTFSPRSSVVLGEGSQLLEK